VELKGGPEHDLDELHVALVEGLALHARDRVLEENVLAVARPCGGEKGVGADTFLICPPVTDETQKATRT
jgi:hypothetical protein